MDVKLANPYKTRVIAEARIKNDRLDAKMLAHLLRANLIAESYIAKGSERAERSNKNEKITNRGQNKNKEQSARYIS